ncbi:MAG: hypothetical protein GXX86_06620 [Propionibacterium sp.]|nr:hypothetical protein [Propionibacterium sp.]
MSIQVNVLEAKTNLSALIAKVLEGERVTIARAGTPVVDLVIHRPRAVTLGTLAGTLDVDVDTFDGVDPEINELFYGDPE